MVQAEDTFETCRATLVVSGDRIAAEAEESRLVAGLVSKRTNAHHTTFFQSLYDVYKFQSHVEQGVNGCHITQIRTLRKTSITTYLSSDHYMPLPPVTLIVSPFT